MNRQKSVIPYSQYFGRNSFKTNRNYPKKEFTLFLIVGLIGCIGTMFYFNLFSISSTPQIFEASQSITISQINSNAVHISKSGMLSITGNPEVHETLNFEIKNFNKRASYEIVYGDGTSKIIETPIFYHSYKEAGNYQILLNIHYKGESKTIFSHSLKISDKV